ncbi:MAG: hypothetical protein K2G54_01190 [Malacoplasma sp.]|nr:hypothetical protein [Malacoplasma sp.]
MHIFKSWFVEFTDREFITFYYSKEQFKTIFIQLLLFIWFTGLSFIYFFAIEWNWYNLGFFSYGELYLFFLSFFILCILIYYPIIISSRPKKVISLYKIHCYLQDFFDFDFETCDDNLINYKIKNSFLGIKFKFSDDNYYSLYSFFNSDLELAEKTREADVGIMNKYFIFPQKIWFKYGKKPEITKDPPVGFCFKYLFSTGFWFLGILSLIYNLLKVKDDFLKKINVIGSVYSVSYFLINILSILLIFPIISQSSFLHLPQSFSETEKYLVRIAILLAVNIVYIHAIGLCISTVVKNHLMT